MSHVTTAADGDRTARFREAHEKRSEDAMYTLQHGSRENSGLTCIFTKLQISNSQQRTMQATFRRCDMSDLPVFVSCLTQPVTAAFSVVSSRYVSALYHVLLLKGAAEAFVMMLGEMKCCWKLYRQAVSKRLWSIHFPTFKLIRMFWKAGTSGVQS